MAGEQRYGGSSPPPLEQQAATPGRLTVTPVFDAKGLRVLRGTPSGPARGPLLVVFNSLLRRGVGPEFIGLAAKSGRPALFVLDHHSTWYASQERVTLVSRQVRAEMDRLGATDIDTLGFSMGAYAALAYGAVLPVRHAVALSPRYSPDPAIVKDPRDRAVLRKLSGNFALPTVVDGMAKAQGGLILHGMRGPDHVQYRHMRAPRQFDHWLMPLADHFVARWLRNRSLLEPIVLAALEGDRDTPSRLLAGLWASRHRSPGAYAKAVPVRGLETLRRWLKPER